jgi:hypothetical protein
LHLEALDSIARLIPIVAIETNTALETRANLVSIVFKATERADLAFKYGIFPTPDAGRSSAINFSFGDQTASDKTFGHREDLTNFSAASFVFL